MLLDFAVQQQKSLHSLAAAALSRQSADSPPSLEAQMAPSSVVTFLGRLHSPVATGRMQGAQTPNSRVHNADDNLD